ncbi:hypothetical protein PoB_000171600 [Plakobranchus ocellatus]|uniref:Cell division cycle protein 27 homolog n=1 Tax=Plakobranchus ocellatus TaxID=259542 RepID=A0AAV3XWM0_9GAST|nr:hypothetical protein PoB_000171600 [Plakobranchus ocellatus]
MEEVVKKIQAIECVFTLNDTEQISEERLREIKPTLKSEIKDLERAENKYEYDDEELCQTLDLLTWVEFKIGSKLIAFELNDKAIAKANSSLESLFSCGNRIHLLWDEGDLIQVESDLNEIDRIKKNTLQHGHRNMIATVKARQAYCYYRLGGPKNLEKAITLYNAALETFPEMHLWRFQAGRAYRRFSNPNMFGENDIDLKLKDEREAKAKEFFHQVTEQSKNPRLRAYAFSDLAECASNRREVDRNLKYFCEQALILCGNDPYVLLNCGKSLRFKDTEKAVELLTKAAKLSCTSHTFHQLGKSLDIFAGRQKNPRASKDLAKQAEERYREAIRLSPKSIPARYSLGILLKWCGEPEMALRKFIQIIGRAFQSNNYALTLMKTYEQASLCLLELYHDPTPSSRLSDNAIKLDFKKEAEEMLIKALSIGFKLLSREEIQTYRSVSLVELQRIADNRRETEKLKLLSRVYRLAKDPEKSLMAVEKLFQIDESEDTDAIMSALEIYLDLGRFEEALALMYRCRDSHTIDNSLRNKVALSAARRRLLQYSGDAALVFKSVFDSYISDSCDKSDVLIVYDDSRDSARDVASLGYICGQLQNLMKTYFGLNASSNIQGCCAGVPEASTQLKEMAKAKLVLLVFGSEELDEYFESLLGFLPSVMERGEDNQSPPQVLVAATEAGVKFPLSVTHFQKIRKLRLNSVVESLQEYEEWHRQRAADVLHEPLNNGRITGCVDNMISFFCSLLSISWPL